MAKFWHRLLASVSNTTTSTGHIWISWRKSLLILQLHTIDDLQVAYITAECLTGCPDPTDTIIRQPNAASEMGFVSQQHGVSLETYTGNYLYDDSAGQGVNVYIVDTGAYTNLPVGTAES